MALTKFLMPVWIFMLEAFGIERQRSAFFDVRVCHPNADSYRDLTPRQIYKNHDNKKKRQYAKKVMHGDRTGNVHSPSFRDHRRNGG